MKNREKSLRCSWWSNRSKTGSSFADGLAPRQSPGSRTCFFSRLPGIEKDSEAQRYAGSTENDFFWKSRMNAASLPQEQLSNLRHFSLVSGRFFSTENTEVNFGWCLQSRPSAVQTFESRFRFHSVFWPRRWRLAAFGLEKSVRNEERRRENGEQLRAELLLR